MNYLINKTILTNKKYVLINFVCLNFLKTTTKQINIETNEMPAPATEMLKKQRQRAAPQLKKSVKIPETTSTSTLTQISQKDLDSYYKSKPILENIYNQFPEKFFHKKSNKSTHLYVGEPKATKIIAKHLFENLHENIPLLEINPGPGVLTKTILDMEHDSNLMLIENMSHFENNLQNILEQHPNKNVKLKFGDFIGMHKLSYQDDFDNGNRIKDLLMDIPPTEWSDDTNLRIFLCTGSILFIKELINSIAFQRGLMALGRPEIFMVIPPPLYIHLTCTRNASYILYRATTMLFQIFFEYKFLAKIPRKYFLPWRTEYEFKKGVFLETIYSIDREYYYYVKIVPRKNLFDLCTPENLPGLWYFIKQHCLRRKNPIIPNLEKLIPNCGPRLLLTPKINQRELIVPLESAQNKLAPKHSIPSTTMSNEDYYQDIDIFTQFGELTPSQILTIFHQFQSWPEYKESPFLASLESHLLKGPASVTTATKSETPEPEEESQITKLTINESNKINKLADDENSDDDVPHTSNIDVDSSDDEDEDDNDDDDNIAPTKIKRTTKFR